MKITAAVKRSPEDPFVIEQVDLDEPRADEILVRIAGVGICHTDVLVATGAFPFSFPCILGHEGSGVVEQVGSAISPSSVRKGDNVVISFRSCGHCDRCGEVGGTPYCRQLAPLNFATRRPDGTCSIRTCNRIDSESEMEISSNFFGQSSFASHVLTYERNVVKVPRPSSEDAGLPLPPLELLGPLGCSIQTGAGGIINSLAVKPDSSILITGGGPVGLSAVMAASYIQKCKTVILLEPLKARRELALELGATHTLDPGNIGQGGKGEKLTLAEAIRKIVPNGVDYAFDATGIPSVLSDIIPCLGSRGMLGLVGVSPPGTPMPGEVAKVLGLGLTIKAILEGDSTPQEFIPILLAHHAAGLLPFQRMIKTYPLSRINEAIDDQKVGKCVKVVLIPE